MFGLSMPMPKEFVQASTCTSSRLNCAAAARFAEALDLFSIAASLGSTESLVVPPALLQLQLAPRQGRPTPQPAARGPPLPLLKGDHQGDPRFAVPLSLAPHEYLLQKFVPAPRRTGQTAPAHSRCGCQHASTSNSRENKAEWIWPQAIKIVDKSGASHLCQTTLHHCKESLSCPPRQQRLLWQDTLWHERSQKEGTLGHTVPRA